MMLLEGEYYFLVPEEVTFKTKEYATIVFPSFGATNNML